MCADVDGSAAFGWAGRSGEAPSGGPPGADRPLPAGCAPARRITGCGCDASRRQPRRGVERRQSHRSGEDVTTSPGPPQGQPARARDGARAGVAPRLRLALGAAFRVSPHRLPGRPALGQAAENEPARALRPSCTRPPAIPFGPPPRNEAPAADTTTTDPRANEILGTEVWRSLPPTGWRLGQEEEGHDGDPGGRRARAFRGPPAD